MTVRRDALAGRASPSPDTAATRSSPDRKSLSWLPAACVLALGLMATIGWLLHLPLLITIAPGLPTLTLNTALCFALVGIGLLMLGRKAADLHVPLAACAAIVVAICLTRICEYVFGFPPGVDRFLSRWLVPADFLDRMGGGMGLNTAIALLLSGGVLMLLAFYTRKTPLRLAREFAGYLILALGMLALAGYVADVSGAYSWAQPAAMSLPTAIGVVLIGLALIIDLSSRAHATVSRIPLWIPAGLCFAALLFDLYTPSSIAAGVVYIPLVLTTAWFTNRRAPFMLAFVCTLLILLGSLASSDSQSVPVWMVAANRGLAIAVLWIVALLVANVVRANDEAEGQSIRFSALAEATPDAIITILPDGTIRSFNRSAEEMFGHARSEIIGKNVSTLMPEPYRSRHDAYLTNYNATGEARIIGTGREVSAMRKDGTVFPMDLSVSQIDTSAGRTFVGVVRDLSERKAQEESLRDALAMLEGYAADLERSNQELDDFASIAAHDLKEPLRAIYNHATFLQEDYGPQLGEDGAHRIGRLVYLSRRMEKLISDLFYVARLGRQDLAEKPNDIGEIIKDIAQTHEQMFAERGARLVVATPLPTVTCDAARLTEVFRNLITNAVKYNDNADKLVEIGHIAGDPSSPGIFYVKDNGRGIAPEFHSEIFRIFRRLQNDDAEDGSGVGLTFIRKIVERHNGEIWLESEPGKGTTFFFCLNGRRGAPEPEIEKGAHVA